MVDRSPSGSDYQPLAEGWKLDPPPAIPPGGELPAWLMDRTVRRWVILRLDDVIRILMRLRDRLLKVDDAPEEPPAPLGQEPFLLEEIEEEEEPET